MSYNLSIIISFFSFICFCPVNFHFIYVFDSRAFLIYKRGNFMLKLIVYNPGLEDLTWKKISWIFAFLRNRCELIHSTNKNHIYIVHLYILLVCLYLINVKTIEPIESKFFVWQPAWPVKKFLKTVKIEHFHRKKFQIYLLKMLQFY